MEDIFSFIDLNEILYDSTDPKYQNRKVYYPGFTKCQIQQISESGLILVTGNDDTGYNHIMKRHNPIRLDTFNCVKEILDTPTTFEYDFLPIIHIILIADDIYTNGEKKSLQDNSPFELYVGKSNALATSYNEYKLLIYKHTKIIHTLYPLKSDSKRKYSLQLRWSGSETMSDMVWHRDAVKIDFENYNGILRVRLEIVHDNHNKKRFVSYALFNDSKQEIAQVDLIELSWVKIELIDLQSYYRFHFDFNEYGIFKEIKKSMKLHNLK
jgi:hypothetical protein